MSLLIPRFPRRRPTIQRLCGLVFPAVVVLVALGLPPAAAGQPPTPPPATAGWQNGFFVQSADGQTRLQVGLLTQFDGRFAVNDPADALTDTFVLRRLRPSIRGRITNRFEFLLTPDLAGGTLVLQDAFIETRFTPSFRLRVGKAKSPFGHERLHSVASMLFIERALPSAIAPNRDVGIQVLGDMAGGALSYSAGILNGSRDGSSSDTDTNDGKDLVGRLVSRPAAGLTLAMSASTGHQSGPAALPTYRTTVFQQPFFAYASSAADGRLTRYSPYVSYYRQAFGGYAEYVRSTLSVATPVRRESLGHEAWQVAGSWVLTGETATEGGVVPHTDFNFGSGGWGALQVAARYQQLTVDQAAFDLGAAAAGSHRRVRAWSAGLNWYLTRYLIYRVHIERTRFDDHDTSRPAENVVAFRSQINF